MKGLYQVNSALDKQPKRIQNKVLEFRKSWSAEFTAGQETNLIKLAKQRAKGKGWGMTRNLLGKYQRGKSETEQSD